MVNSTCKEWKCTALTDIWTGDASRKGERLVHTGLLGSIRWWFEVMVRALGGKACDPTATGVRCPQDSKNKNKKKPTDPGHHCVVCELFGCTGWARKFRFEVLEESGQTQQEQINKDQTFILRFTELRPIRDEEWCLLELTLRLIAEYGAIGGKTLFKPSDDRNRRNAFHHKDFGLIQYASSPEGWRCTKSLDELKAYMTRSQWRPAPHTYRDSEGHEHDYSWASLANFWCVKGRYLARQNADTSSFNFVIGRPKCKGQSSQGDSWLAGRRPDRRRNIDPESKKVFSFKYPENGTRTFGFVKPGAVDFDEMKNRLAQVWQDFDPDREFLTGKQILKQLFGQEENS